MAEPFLRTGLIAIREYDSKYPVSKLRKLQGETGRLYRYAHSAKLTPARNRK